MADGYYYSHGRRIPVTRLHSARVVPSAPDGQRAIRQGWHTVLLASPKFQLLVRDDLALDERSLKAPWLNDLVSALVAAQRSIGTPSRPGREADELEEGLPVLLDPEGALLLPTGQVIVEFPPHSTASAVQKVLARRGASLVRAVDLLPDTYLVRPASGDGLDLAAELIEDRVAEFAAPNFLEEIPPRRVVAPPNELFQRQWHLNDPTASRQNRSDIRALEAWQLTRGSPDVTICIIDSGVQASHESFSAPGKLTAGFDFEEDDISPDPSVSSHGTSCAGVAAAAWGRGKVVGAAPDCAIMPVRRASLSEHIKLAEALAWAAGNGADVISCSFGYDNRPWILPDVVRRTLRRVVREGRHGRGCIIVWAAGNGNEDIGSDEWASNPDVIAVAACTDDGERAWYSDYGSAVWCCAPSSGGSKGITTATINGYTDEFGGTSSAAPLVAGVVALVLTLNPNLTVSDIRDILRRSSDRIASANGEYDEAGHSRSFGYGRVNAARALQAIDVLQEATRGSALEGRAPDIERFVDAHLRSRTSGRALLAALTRLRFLLLSLLVDEADFRNDCLTILDWCARAPTEGVLTVDRTVSTALEGLLMMIKQHTSHHRQEDVMPTDRSSGGRDDEERGPLAKSWEMRTDTDPSDSAAAILGRLAADDPPRLDRSHVGGRSAPGESATPSLEQFAADVAAGVLRAIEAHRAVASGDGLRSATSKSVSLPTITFGMIFEPPREPPEKKLDAR